MWPSSVENPDVVDVIDAASMELESGFISETAMEITEKTVCYPSVRAVEYQLIVTCSADEGCDPVCALDVCREFRVNICGSFEDPQHLLVFFDTTVDVGVAACHLMESLLLVDHVLKEKNVLILVFRVPAQPIDRLAQAIKSSFLSFGFPVVVGVLTPHLSGGLVFRARSRRAYRRTCWIFVKAMNAAQVLPVVLHAPLRVCSGDQTLYAPR